MSKKEPKSELPKGWRPPPALVADLKKVVELLKARDNTNNGRRTG